MFVPGNIDPLALYPVRLAGTSIRDVLCPVKSSHQSLAVTKAWAGIEECISAIAFPGLYVNAIFGLLCSETVLRLLMSLVRKY